MATKPQAKTAIDNAVTNAKADMDNILPATFNYVDGQISFSPTRAFIVGDAGGVAVTADGWLTTITTNLTAATRPHNVRRVGRRSEDSTKQIVITTTTTPFLVVFINNVG